jgi:aryl-alcohol dehydrogenase-like predicted oxidoreductase
LQSISRYTLGTANLKDKNNPEHVRVARTAMDAGIWFHSSTEYADGAVFATLAKAFKEDPKHIPHCIFKIKSWDKEILEQTVTEAITVLGVPRVEIAQICWYMPDADKDLKPGCALHEKMCELKEKGMVVNYVLEFLRPTTENMIRIVERELFDGYIYYHNVVNREVSNQMYDLLLSKKAPILALRTVGGGAGDLGFAPKEEADFVRGKLREWTERSGCASEIEMRMRFPLSHQHNLTTVGATTKVKNLMSFLEMGKHHVPLPKDVLDEIDALHRRWFAD